MGDFDKRQLEQLNAIGEYLKDIRQDQGRSLDDISAKTYIPLRILRALESGQGAILPEPVFVQGFIRRYGDALGLDGTSLSRSFPLEREASSYDSPEAERTEPAQTLVSTRLPDARHTDTRRPNSAYVDRSADRAIEESAPRRRQQQISLPASLPFALAAILVLGGLLYGLSRLLSPQQSETTKTASPPASAPKASTAAAPPTASPAPAGTASSPATSPAASPAVTNSPKPAPTNSPINVAMNVTADSWVEVTTDGRVTFEGILKKGTQRNWFAQKELTIVSGNAGGVSLSYNQGAAKPMGSPGTVEEATFTPSGNPASSNGAASN